MADHVRTQVRDAVKTLVTGLTTTGANAFAGRPESRPLQESELPGLLVYTNEEESEHVAGQQGSRRKARNGQLMVHGFAQSTADIDKTLDTIAKEVEAALEAAPTLSGLAKDLYHTNTEKRSDPEAAKPTGEIVLTFTCEYHTREGIPDAALA
jgi:hypothetical protein